MKFQPADFYRWKDEVFIADLADHANALLHERLLKDAVRVFGETSDGAGLWCHAPMDGNGVRHTHQALLINIEPIKRECEHVPAKSREDYDYGAIIYKQDLALCAKCGVKLRAKWEVARGE